MFPLPMEEPDVLLFLTLIASYNNEESGLDVSEAIKVSDSLMFSKIRPCKDIPELPITNNSSPNNWQNMTVFSHCYSLQNWSIL